MRLLRPERTLFRMMPWLSLSWVILASFTVTLSVGHGPPWHGGEERGCFRSLRSATSSSATTLFSSVGFPSGILVLTPVKLTTAMAVLLLILSLFKLSVRSTQLMRMRSSSVGTCSRLLSRILDSFLPLRLLLLLLIELARLRLATLRRLPDPTWVALTLSN